MLSELFDGSISIDSSQQGKSLLSTLPTCKGVVLFADSSDRPILLISAANIRRIVHSRLTERTAKRADISAAAAKAYYLCCYNDFRCAIRYHDIARRLFADNYAGLMGKLRTYYVKIEMSDKRPVFNVSVRPRINAKIKTFGPFASNKDAAQFLGALQEAFGLCKRQHLLNQPDKSVSCPYLQMHNCCGVCRGRIAPDEYLRYAESALDAASKNTEKYSRLFRTQMEECAGKLEFEKAQQIKKKLAMLSVLEKDCYKWVGDLTKFTILHIDRSAKIKPEGAKKKTQTYAGFVIRYGRISESEDFDIDSTGSFAEFVKKRTPEPVEINDEKFAAEQMAIVSGFLYRSSAQGIWLIANQKYTTGQLTDVIAGTYLYKQTPKK